MLSAALRMLGAGLQQQVARIKTSITDQVKETGLTVGLMAGGAIAALLTFCVALVALYLWVEMHKGPFVALAVVGGLNAAITALLFGIAIWRQRSGAARVDVLQPSPSAATVSKSLAALLRAPHSRASTFDHVTHTVTAHAVAAGEEAVDAAADILRTGSRKAVVATLAGAVLLGVLLGRRA